MSCAVFPGLRSTASLRTPSLPGCTSPWNPMSASQRINEAERPASALLTQPPRRPITCGHSALSTVSPTDSLSHARSEYSPGTASTSKRHGQNNRRLRTPDVLRTPGDP
ncbi:hypothetical protein BD413DRAFT_238587 [Trametes elegans]|nr:hypothetical protein BD413DRAFT_238587 [Trametes elegans]